jgi:hypothetical protein
VVAGPLETGDTLRKKHGLQGPIDDAFMDRFLFVRPTGTAANEKAGAWAQAEMARAVEQWRRQFRGDVRIKDDTQVTEDDIRDSHLVLWGDPASNASWAGSRATRCRSRGPAGHRGRRAHVSRREPRVDRHLPESAESGKYVVLNSGFTFREYDQLNNARQTPKLPDWAVIDLDTPPDSRHPGGHRRSGLFRRTLGTQTGRTLSGAHRLKYRRKRRNRRPGAKQGSTTCFTIHTRRFRPTRPGLQRTVVL